MKSTVKKVQNPTTSEPFYGTIERSKNNYYGYNYSGGEFDG